MKITFRKSLFFILPIVILCFTSCATKSTNVTKTHKNEDDRKENKDNFLFAQARRIIHYNQKNEDARERKKNKQQGKMLGFLQRLNKKDKSTQAKAVVPPFKP